MDPGAIAAASPEDLDDADPRPEDTAAGQTVHDHVVAAARNAAGSDLFELSQSARITGVAGIVDSSGADIEATRSPAAAFFYGRKRVIRDPADGAHDFLEITIRQR
jgi:hypothetical protein